MSEDVNELLKGTYLRSKSKGFWEQEEIIVKLYNHEMLTKDEIMQVINAFKCQRIALIHSEVSELLEGIRNGVENEDEELADIVIRCNDYAGGYGINLEKAIIEKIEFNNQRPYKHGKKF